MCAHAHTHTYVQPNQFAIHPRLLQHRQSTALQSQNKACICLTLKLYTLCFTSYRKQDDCKLGLTAPALSRDSCQVQCWPHREDADPAELSGNSIRKRGCYHPWLPAHKPGPHLCRPLHACVILATRGARLKKTGFAAGNHTPVCTLTSFPVKLTPDACSTAGDLYGYLRSSWRRPSGGRHCCRWRACT